MAEPPAALPARPLRIVLDTNVLVSGMLSPFRPPARVLDLLLARELVLLMDDRIAAEYREVVARARFGLDPDESGRVLATLEALAEQVAARPLPVQLADADDLPFLEVAAAGAADALVTGNVRHLQALAGRHPVPVLTPRELLEYLAENA